MESLKKSTAWLLVLCLVLSLALAVGPMTTEVNAETFDPYVYYWSLNSDQYPAYYSRYASPYMMYCVHTVHALSQEEDSALMVRFFNLVNTAALIEDEAQAPSGGYATTGAFCVDAETSLQYGAAYRRMNLEEAYFSINEDGSVSVGPARHIRAIMRNSMPYVTDMAALEQNVNAYLTDTYGEDAVLVSGLTGAQLVGTVQAALWHYSNGLDFSDPYPYYDTEDFENWSELWTDYNRLSITYPDIPDNFMDPVTDTTATNMSGLYQYLINLPGEDAKEIAITDGAISMEDAVITGSGDECTLTMLIKINGTINDDDDLIFTAKCGDRTQTHSLGATNTLDKLDNGLYSLTFEGVSAEDCQSVQLVLSGQQTVEDVCFFQAKPTEDADTRKASQNLTGFGHDSAPVYSEATVNALDATTTLELTKVDEGSGNPLQGVAFELYRKLDNQDLLMGSFITDEKGKVTVAVADAGEYYFTETRALTGYEPIRGQIAPGEVSNRWSSGVLEVSKKLINTTPAQVGETFNFKLKLDLSTAPVLGNGFEWMTEQYLMAQLDCSKELTWTVSGDRELTATFTVNADETVTVEGIPLGTTYTLEEVLSDEDRQWFSVTTKVDGDDAVKGDTVSGTVAEANSVLFTNSVVTGPELKLGELAVSKKLINTTPAQVGETFDFRITLDFSTADVYTNGAPWMNDDYLLSKVTCSESLTWKEQEGKYTATFTVDADETVTVEGLAYGTTYTLEEVLTEENRQWFEVTAKVDDAEAKDGTVATGTVAEHNGVLFTNSVVTCDLQLSKLAVSKKLINTTPAQVGETFNFRITLDFSTADVYRNPVFWMNDEYLMGFLSSAETLDWKEENGKYTATFTVDAEETVAIEGLALGTTYTLEEILTEEERQWFAVTSKVCNEETRNSSITESTVANLNAVLFTNSVVTGPELKLGELAVSKKLINTTPAQVGETFNFRITLDFSTADVYTDPAFWMNDEYLMEFLSSTETLDWKEENGKYTATFTVDAEETVAIEGLALGTTYTVEELLTEEELKWFIGSAQIGDGESLEGRVAQSTVAEQNAVIFTNSVVTGPVLVTGGVEVSKKLVNTTPAKVGETFNFRMTLDFSTADVYTDAAPWMTDEYLMGFVTGTQELTWNCEDGKYSADFTVKADETFSISGIALGTTYTVEEILTEEDRQWFTVTSKLGQGEEQDSAIVESVVAESNAILFTNSVVTGIQLDTGTMEATKKVTDAGTAKDHETFTFRLTLDLSEAEIYQDPAPWMYDEYLLDRIEADRPLTWTKAGEKKYTTTFTLKANEMISIDGLALGTGFELEEILTVQERQLYQVSTNHSSDGGAAVEGKTALVSGKISDKNQVTITNKYLEPIPVTDDCSLIAPVVLSLLAVLMGAVMMLNKRSVMSR